MHRINSRIPISRRYLDVRNLVRSGYFHDPAPFNRSDGRAAAQQNPKFHCKNVLLALNKPNFSTTCCCSAAYVYLVVVAELEKTMLEC